MEFLVKIKEHFNLKVSDILLAIAMFVLAVIGYQLYSHAEGYKYLSDEHTLEIVKSKLWSLSWILISAAVIYWKRDKFYTPAFTVFAVSSYFVILYGIMFSGTEYGMNGHCL